MDSELSQIFSDFYTEIKVLTPRLITALAVVVFFWIVGRIFHHLIGLRIQRRWHDSIVSRFIAEASKYGIYFLGLIIALNLVGFGGIASGVIAGAGVGAIVFGFAFKDIGENFLAGILLALSRPFEIGDIIEVEGHKGKVSGLDLRTTQLRNAEGKDIFLPNSMLLKNSLINYTKDGFLRVNFLIGVAPESDLALVRELILDYLSGVDEVLAAPEPKVVTQELGEFTVDMNVFFWVDILANAALPDTYLGQNIRSKVIEDVKLLLDKNGIEMPSQVLEHKMYRNNSFDIKK